MAIDASIISGLKPFQVESPVDNYAKMMSLQDLMQKSQLGQISIQDHQQKQAADNTLSRLMSQGLSPADISTGLASAGHGNAAMAYTKMQQDSAEAKAKTNHFIEQSGKLQSERLDQAIDRHRNQLGAVNDYPGAVAWATAGYNNPQFSDLVKSGGKTLDETIATIPQDPAGFEKWKMQSSLSADKLIQMTRPDANAVLSAQTSTDNSVRTAASSKYATDSTSGTAKLGREQSAFQHSQTLAQGKVPSGYRANADGSVSAIPGGPADVTKPTADYLKQADAYQNMDDALVNYKGKLATFGTFSQLNPSARAEMGQAYQNALLQAKEIYKLGVLNGGDERILKGIINSPLDIASSLIPKDALVKQANDLQGIIKRANENLSKVNKQATLPLNSQAGTAAPSIPSGSSGASKPNSNIDALLDKYK